MQYTRKQLEFIEINAVALTFGLAADSQTHLVAIPEKVFDTAERMLVEREKRYGKIGEEKFADE